MTRIIGKPNVSPVGSIELSSSFNRWALGSKLLTIEELDALEKTVIRHKLHPIITQETSDDQRQGHPNISRPTTVSASSP